MLEERQQLVKHLSKSRWLGSVVLSSVLKLSLHAMRCECLMCQIKRDQDCFGAEYWVAEDCLSSFRITVDVEFCVGGDVADARLLLPGGVDERRAERRGGEVVPDATAHDVEATDV